MTGINNLHHVIEPKRNFVSSISYQINTIRKFAGFHAVE